MSFMDEPPAGRETQCQVWQGHNEKNQRDGSSSFGTNEAEIADTPEEGVLARWEYTSDEWALFETLDWHSRHLKFWQLSVAGLFPLSLTIVPWVLYSPESTHFDQVLVLVGFPSGLLSTLAFAFFWLSALFACYDAKKRHKARRGQPQTVAFSKQGVWEAKTYFPLNQTGVVNLKTVTLTSHPPVLHFRMEKLDETDPEGQRPDMVLDVLVPHGHEGEAGQILEHFQRVALSRT